MLPAAVAAALLAAPAEPFRLSWTFDADLAGWEQRGPAEFSIDPAERHEGAAAARIVIAAGTPLSYQQLAWTVAEVRHGDTFEARAWVRTRGVDEGTGAYAALEFVDAGGQRVGIEHSKVSAANGRAGWEELAITGIAPRGTAAAKLSLILHAEGTAWFDAVSLQRTGRLEPWPDLGGAPRTVTLHPDRVVQPRFGGVGYHMFHHAHTFTERQLNEVVFKRWRELAPSFARLNDSNDWDAERLELVARHLAELKRTGTEIYFATWGPRDVPAGEPRRAYAREVADRLEWFYRQRGADHIRTFCLTNELSLNRWGELMDDLPKFADYHRELHAEFARRGLPIQLLATDASPIGYWHSIDWATRNMDEVTEVYGGHHYLNEWTLEDERFYPWWLERLRWGVGLARGKGKEFILGEFGSKQDGRTVDGVRLDRCVYFETPEEPMVAVQMAEAVIGALNAGVYALGYWTFMDFPDDYNPSYANKWGLFRWSGEDMSCRAHYVPYGLLSKYFRGPARVVEVETNDPYLRAAALRTDDGEWSVAVVNRYAGAVPLTIGVPAGGKPFRRYLYDPLAPPAPAFGDLPEPDRLLPATDGILRDELPAGGVVVYTSRYDTAPPAAPTGVRATREGERTRVTWTASPAADLCYYRVWRVDGGRREQIGSTIATELTAATPPGGRYEVTAVDNSANSSAAAGE